LGMDIVLYVLDDKGDEFYFIEEIDGEVSLPKEIKEKAYFKKVDVLNYSKAIKDLGFRDEDVEGVHDGLDGDIKIFLKNGKIVKIPEKEFVEKYTETEIVHAVKVREVMYRRYSYSDRNFKEGKHPLDTEPELLGLKPYYFDPDEMAKVDIFVDRSKWDEVVNKFKDLKSKGYLCFVRVSY